MLIDLGAVAATLSAQFSFLAVGGPLVALGYALYQVPQRIRLRRDISLHLPIDSRIPFRPAWTWVYVFAYFPLLAVMAFLVSDWADFVATSLSLVSILVVHIAISLAYPVRVPDEWRIADAGRDLSTRLLQLVQKIDKGGNCFPSMHVALSVLVAFHLQRLTHGPVLLDMAIWSCPMLVSASTVFTKQHFFADIPAGVVLGTLGWVVYLYVIV